MPRSEKTRIGEIRYNPTTQRFEALVTFEAETGTRRVAASLAAPLTAEFETLAKGLVDKARATLITPGTLKSRQKPLLTRPPIPAPQPQASGFDWIGMLHGQSAA